MGIAERVLNGQRYQIIAVIRGDEIAECWVPLPTVPGQREFDIFCGLEHSVGEARDWADEMRVDRHWEEFLAEESANSTLFERYQRQVENDVEILRNRTVFGAGRTAPTIQRNGFHPTRRDKQQFGGISLPAGN